MALNYKRMSKNKVKNQNSKVVQACTAPTGIGQPPFGDNGTARMQTDRKEGKNNCEKRRYNRKGVYKEQAKRTTFVGREIAYNTYLDP